MLLWKGGTRTYAAEPRLLRDIEYARVGEHRLLLDLYLPPEGRSDVPKPRLIVWIHGGAWRAWLKSDMPLKPLVDMGYAIASVDYRLSTAAPFPAQVTTSRPRSGSCAPAADYGYDPSHIAVAGNSAGGHLAALVGVTNGNTDMEGTVGEDPEQNSDVQAIVSLYGMSDLTTPPQSTPHGLEVRVPALQLLLGGPAGQKSELARLPARSFTSTPPTRRCC